MHSTELGFTEECDSKLLTNRYFPTKIGGKPAFLDLENLPTEKDLLCANCNEPCILLCQYYAPIEDRDDCFHRTIFLFACKNASCCESNSAKNFIVFRNQLPRINNFYSSEPPNEDDVLDEIPTAVKLCRVCGCRGKSLCARCKKASYCGPVHQKVDWKFVHKEQCQLPDSERSPNSDLSYLFPEFNLIIETEEKRELAKDDEESDERRLKEYENLVKSGKTGELENISEEELQQFSSSSEDKIFGKFRKIVAYDPEQVIRYNRCGKPLWISSDNQVSMESVPKCENCNGDRIFEFQVMPQLLNSLGNDELDWGILAVYTCKDSCNSNSKYIKEFVYKQDIVK